MFHSIRNRLIALCVAITVVAMLALSLATIYVARQNTVAQVDASIGQITRDQADSLAAWVLDKQRITAALGQAYEQPDDFARHMAATTQQAGGFDDAYMVYADKRLIFNHPLPTGYDGTSRVWYQMASRTDGPILTPAYVGASSRKLMVTFAQAVRRNGGVVAVVGTDMLMESLVKRVNAIQATPKSFAFLLDEKGNILAHHNADLTLKPVSAIDASLDLAELHGLAQDRGSVEKDINGEGQVLYAANVAGTPWTLVVSIDRALANVPVTDMMKLAASITVLALLAAVALLMVTVRRQLRGLPQVQAALEDIASGDGDLTRRLPAQGKDELSQIGAAFNHFADKIANVLRQIREASVSVRAASLEIAAGNQDLSMRTAQQASSLEETAAAMEQLTATVQHNAANAQQAASLAEDASGVAANSGSAMRDVVQTMNGIDASARKIVDIISVIDGIAFQTNILALNAAVEAARAGEQGRGFAVVATEVRTLAQRSATAAREIKDLIETSVRQVDEGNALVKRAGGTMEQVVTSVDRVTSIVREINIASQEQSTGIGEVNGAVNLMDQSTQQNSALVEEAAAAAQTLQEQAVHLAALVAEFKLEHDSAAPAIAPRRMMAAPLLAHDA